MPEPKNPRKNVESDFQMRYAARFKRHAHRKDIQTRLWDTWLLLVTTIATAAHKLHGLRTGEWVDLFWDGTTGVDGGRPHIRRTAAQPRMLPSVVNLKETEPVMQIGGRAG